MTFLAHSRALISGVFRFNYHRLCILEQSTAYKFSTQEQMLIYNLQCISYFMNNDRGYQMFTA
jgi:hypothetical protein